VSDLKQYVIIIGNDFSLREKSATEYVSGIVYGAPKVTAVKVSDGQRGHFVALCEYTNQDVYAHSTHDRMGSFSYGASFAPNEREAFTEFGKWVAYYAETFDWAASQHPDWNPSEAGV
jgi:hypothetical protein